MAEVKIFHDREGQTLTVWFTDPSLEHVSEETGDEHPLRTHIQSLPAEASEERYARFRRLPE